jgi:hypothetical protein
VAILAGVLVAGFIALVVAAVAVIRSGVLGEDFLTRR